MTVNRLIAALIVSLIGLTAYGLFNGISILVSLGHVVTLPMIGLWYASKRKWSTTSIDWAVYLTYLVGSFSDSVILIGGQIGEILQIFMTLIMHMILIIIFRKEGTRIYSDKLKDLPKVLIPVSIIFVFFGIVLIPILPNALYFLSILYAIQEMILVSHGLFRNVKGRSYFWVAIGVSLIIIKDVLYSYNFFIYQNKILYLYIIQYSLSAIVYFMIAIGLAFNQNNKNTEPEKNIWIYLKNAIKIALKNHHLTHFWKSLSESIILKKGAIKRNFSIFWDVLGETNKIF